MRDTEIPVNVFMIFFVVASLTVTGYVYGLAKHVMIQDNAKETRTKLETHEGTASGGTVGISVI